MPLKGLKGGVSVKPLGYGLGVAAEEATEPNFNQTVLLLHADGSEGAGNTSALGSPNYKAFRDNSTSAHAITVQGDAYGNDFSPYYYADGYWSNLFTVNNTDIEFTSTSNVQLDGVFTIEFFVRLNTLSVDSQHPSVLTFPTNGSNITQVYINATGKYVGLYYGSDLIKTDNDSMTLNTWHHVVVARDSSSNIALWLNGSRVSSLYTGVSKAVTFGASSGDFNIGSYNGSGGEVDGYLSNVRIVKGYDVYGTTNTSITVPTAPLTAITGTGLLTCQSNRFIDNASSPHALTVGSGQSISTNTPFTQSKTANVGSGFFDGDTTSTVSRSTTGDKIFTTSTSSDFAFGTGDFTVECWVYPNGSVTDARGIVGNRNAGTNTVWALHYAGSIGNNVLHWHTGLSAVVNSSPHIVTPNAWNHLAVTKESGTARMYINGVQVATWTDGYDYSTVFNLDIAEGIYTNSFNGYIADVNIIKGTAKYTGASSFNVPTSTISADGNTKFLACQYSGAVRNVGFLDDSKYNHQITRIGAASIGTFSPFSVEDGYWSSYFNGNHPIEIADSGNGLDLSGDFTIEFWAYETKIATAGGTTNIYFSIDALDDFQFSQNGTDLRLGMNNNTVIITSSSNPSLNQWNHLAVVREGSGSNNISLYVNGTRVTQGTSTFSIAASSMMLGGQDRGSTTGNHGFFGYISNFRILKGTALYSGTSITVPTTPLTAIANTSLLTCQSNRYVDNSTNNMVHTTDSSSPNRILSFSPFAPTRSYSKDAVGGSAFFNGAGNKLQINAQHATAFRLDDGEEWCIEFWVYMINPTENFARVMQINNGDGWAIRFDATSGKIGLGRSDAGSTDSIEDATALQRRQWTHFAFTNKNQSGTYHLRLFRNGVQVATTSSWTQGWTNADNTASAGNLMIASYYNDSYPGKLYLGTTRLIQGDYVYDSAFTPTTVPLAATDKTTLLLNFNNAGIIDHTMRNNLNTNGNVRISGQQKKFGTGSIYFDGADELSSTFENQLLYMGTGDFTAECFFYSSATQSDADPGSLMIYIGNGTQNAIWVALDSGGKVRGNVGYNSSWATELGSSTTISNNTWYHVALERYNGTLKLFINGTSEASSSNSTDLNSTYGGNISLGYQYGTARKFEGYLDEVRVTKIGRYQGSNFTAPTRAFANK